MSEVYNIYRNKIILEYDGLMWTGQPAWGLVEEADDEREEWIKENIRGNWNKGYIYASNASRRCGYKKKGLALTHYYFQYKTDAMAFKMRWVD